MQIEKNFNNNSITITQQFDAPIQQVWNALTQAERLDQWWGPAPWRAVTHHIDVVAGGFWRYVMIGPENEQHWGQMNYRTVEPYQTLGIEDVFCDQHGNTNNDLPISTGSISLLPINEQQTHVQFSTHYPTQADLQQLIDMGFEQGITISFAQLSQLLNRSTD